MLSKVIVEIARLPPERQDEIAEKFRQGSEEREWDELVARPESQRILEELAAEARRAHAEGRTNESIDRW